VVEVVLVSDECGVLVQGLGEDETFGAKGYGRECDVGWGESDYVGSHFVFVVAV